METYFKINSNGEIETLTGDLWHSSREHKRKSELLLLDDYIVIDIETTGLDPHHCEIIELGAQKYINNTLADEYFQLVKPFYKIDDFITDLTGITNEMVSSSPKIQDALPEFLDFIGDFTLVAHNANFDVNFLYDYCEDYLDVYFDKHFVDTLRLSRLIFRELKSHKLKVLNEEFNLLHRPTHRVKDDCTCTHLLYQHIKTYMLENNLSITDIKPQKKHLDARDITATNNDFDTSHPIYGRKFVFTGILEKMVRKDAMQLVANLGGVNQNGVNKQTNYLVLGNNDFCMSIKDGKSLKQKKAEKLALEGQEIEIISENVFYDMISD